MSPSLPQIRSTNIQHPKHRSSLVHYFIAAALLFAIFGGFGLAGHLTTVLAFGYSPGPNILSLIQAHGHIQLVGWTGLLFIGVSLHLLPRLLSRPLPPGSLTVLTLAASGLLTRSVAQILLPYMRDDASSVLLSRFFLGGAALESAAFFLYALIVAGLLRQRGIDLFRHSAVTRLLPYLVSIIAGSMAYAAVNIKSVLGSFTVRLEIVDLGAQAVANEVFLYLILLPGSMLFSAKLVPIFLGLREPRWPVGIVGGFYAAAAWLWLFRHALPDWGSFAEVTFRAASFSIGAAFLAFIWYLDVLTRRHPPERLEPLRDNSMLRGRGVLPDRGEYGCFELHVYAAYLWLALGASAHVAPLLRMTFPVDTLRHILLAGYLSNLIVGIGYRLFPALLGVPLAFRGLVLLTAILLNLAVIGRLLPALLAALEITQDTGMLIARVGYGSSGNVALVAIALFALNVAWRRIKPPRSGKGRASTATLP